MMYGHNTLKKYLEWLSLLPIEYPVVGICIPAGTCVPGYPGIFMPGSMHICIM